MRTFYQKALIISVAAILIEIIIILFLNSSINAFYNDLTKNIAFLLTEKVIDVINAQKLNLDKIDQYSRFPTRRLLKRVSGSDSEILHVLVVDTTMKIIVSDDPSVEGKVYQNEEERQYFNTDEPRVINSDRSSSHDDVEVIYPIFQDNIKKGYIRTVISVTHLDTFYSSRRLIIILASIISFVIIIGTVLLTSRIYRSGLLDIQKALENLQESDYQVRLDYKQKDEFAPLFSRLNDLFQQTLDLNASYEESENRSGS